MRRNDREVINIDEPPSKILVEAATERAKGTDRECGSEVIITDVSSQILVEEDMVNVLSKMLAGSFPGQKRLSLTHLRTFRKRDSTTTQEFHDAVGNLGQILTVMKSKEGHIFGAYVHDAITCDDHSGWITGSFYNFLFALGNLTKVSTKLVRDTGDGLWYGRHGLAMGNTGPSQHVSWRYPYDFVMFHNCNSFVNTCIPTAYKTFAPGYQVVELQDGTLCGTPGFKTFTPSIIEIFHATSA